MLAVTQCTIVSFSQQISDSSFYWNRINGEHLRSDTSDVFGNLKTRTASLFNTTASEKNEMVIIITSAQIIRYNYLTLADVLRDLPGFLVTQPGSFSQGEMFHYNGLSGNENFSILVNGVPVRSSLSHGMAIGANLPIQQAMRIEIVFSPQSAMHGNGAAFGVINIITPQTERPVYIKAAIGGNTQPNNNLSLIVGGKFGSEKNPVRFDMYGNFLERSNIKFTNNDVFVDSIYNTPNYKVTAQNETDPLSQSSKLIGMNAYYKRYHFSVVSGSHKEQSSLGLNPLSVNRTSANQYFSEQTTVLALTTEKDKPRTGKLFTGIYYIKYKTAPSSSFRFSNPVLKRNALDYASNLSAGNPNRDSIVNINANYLNNNYFDNVRYINGNGVDLILERSRKMTIKNIKVFIGFDFISNIGYPLLIMSRTKSITQVSIDSSRYDIGNVLSLLHFAANLKYGIEYSRKNYTLGGLVRTCVSTRYAVAQSKNGNALDVNHMVNVYAKRILNSGKSLLFTVNEGFTEFSSFYFANQFKIIQVNTPSSLVDIQRSFVNQSAMRTRDIRVSFVRISKNLPTLYITGFYQMASSIPRSFMLSEDGKIMEKPGYNDFSFGYFSPSSSKRNSFGISFNTDILIELNINSTGTKSADQKDNILHFIVNGYFAKSSTTYLPHYTSSKEALIQPNSYLITELQYSFKRKFDFSIQYHYLGKFKPEGNTNESISSQSFFDLLASYKLSRNFTSSLRLYNIFNTSLFGASATGSNDDLIKNPIRREYLILKLNYVVE